jgi:ABC-type sugar transport system substrate-binding protein
VVDADKFFHTPLNCTWSPTTDELLAYKAPKAHEPYDLTFMEVSLAAYSYQAYAYGAEQAAKDAGVNLSIVAGKGYASPEAQLADADIVLHRGTDGLLLAPVDITGSVPIVQRAKAEGIPVVNVSTELASPDVITVMQDDYLQGRIAADQVAKLVPDGGHGIVMGGPANATWARKRVAGFQDAIREKYPNITIDEVTNQLVDPGEGATDFQNAIQAHPNVDWIYSVFVFVLPPDSIPAAYRDVPHVTSGYEPIVRDALAAGTLGASISIDQYAMGYMGVSELVAALNGDPTHNVLCLPQPVFTNEDRTGNAYADREIYPPSFKAQAD